MKRSLKTIKLFIIPALIIILSQVLIFLVNTLEYFPENMDNAMIKTGQVFLVTGIAWGLIGFIRTGKHQMLQYYDISESDNLRMRKLHTQYNIFEKILVFLTIIISVAVSLMLFESVRNIGVSLFATAGVAGIIVGLSAQKAIATLLAGFQIAITQPIRLDDVVIVENEWGWVDEINLTYVVIRIWDKRRLVVPTTYFLEKPFQNWTRTSAEILGSVYIYTDYTMPVQPLRDELSRILKTTNDWDGKVNVLQVTNATDRTLELRALMSAATSPKAWDLRVYVREKLIEFIQINYMECLPKTRVELPGVDKKENQQDQQRNNNSDLA